MIALNADAKDLNLVDASNPCDPSNRSLWRETFNIRSYQVGPSGLVTPQALCRFLQEAASNHAEVLNVGGEELAEQNLMWVLSRLRLRLKETPRWRQRVMIETWPSKRTSGVRAHRDFRLLGENGQQIGEASTIWLLLSKKSRRPVRIPDFLELSRLPGLTEDLMENSEVELVGQSDFERHYEVLATDLDFNNHVNNVCYLEWALNSLPLKLLESHRICDLRFNFLAEGHYGDHILARTQKSGLGDLLVCRHSLETIIGERRLAAIETVWA